ncbi:hypothetical protein TIFTF001_013793 [Ficus carica]|uniref:Uncharacterized protein n=1 Tax=Ficus carica TaxID=3494 RepID=A0AA88AIH3_FICCA|nr:hypothetical protein TIFTF001_013793 [Ficus carica]
MLGAAAGVVGGGGDLDRSLRGGDTWFWVRIRGEGGNPDQFGVWEGGWRHLVLGSNSEGGEQPRSDQSLGGWRHLVLGSDLGEGSSTEWRGLVVGDDSFSFSSSSLSLSPPL